MSARLTLIPAIRKADRIYPGQPGGSHKEIILAHRLGLKAPDNEHIFLTHDDRPLTREQGMDWLKRSQPAAYAKLDAKDVTELRSSDLPGRRSVKQRMEDEPL